MYVCVNCWNSYPCLNSPVKSCDSTKPFIYLLIVKNFRWLEFETDLTVVSFGNIENIIFPTVIWKIQEFSKTIFVWVIIIIAGVILNQIAWLWTCGRLMEVGAQHRFNNVYNVCIFLHALHVLIMQCFFQLCMQGLNLCENNSSCLWFNECKLEPKHWTHVHLS